jgi:hypothetical protein
VDHLGRREPRPARVGRRARRSGFSRRGSADSSSMPRGCQGHRLLARRQPPGGRRSRTAVSVHDTEAAGAPLELAGTTSTSRRPSRPTAAFS